MLAVLILTLDCGPICGFDSKIKNDRNSSVFLPSRIEFG
ncbi:hypothetical protein LEP1GSC127_1607 [Leptospira kirschneri str. 200801925]|nr:hypothetical protein LEP1GSC127_1607 [Leptospira kirschneri str. 200801925]